MIVLKCENKCFTAEEVFNLKDITYHLNTAYGLFNDYSVPMNKIGLLAEILLKYPTIIISYLDYRENENLLVGTPEIRYKADNEAEFEELIAKHKDDYIILHFLSKQEDVYDISLYKLTEKVFCPALDTAIRKNMLNDIINEIC